MGPRALVLALGLVAAAASSPASAAIQIGETFDPTNSCGGSNTNFQTSSPGDRYTVPIDGVITSWSFQADEAVNVLKFKVARPQGGSTFTVVGESELKAPVSNMLNTFTDIQIPVKAGDVIGLFTASGRCHRTPPAPLFGNVFTSGDTPPGTTADFSTGGGFQFDVSALVEADCDADGLGDETQDSGLAECNPRSLTLETSKPKTKRGKRIRFFGLLDHPGNDPACESAQSLTLERKKAHQDQFASFAQVETDSGGAFSLSARVKKTFEYRAQVAETALCGSQTSDVEKVKVKKRR